MKSNGVPPAAGERKRGATTFRGHRRGRVGMRVMLDSNVYSQLMRGREQVSRIVRGAEEILLSAVVLGELLYGFHHGSRYERNIQQMRAFLDNPYVSLVPVGATTADRYSRIAASLRAKGRPLPTNDVTAVPAACTRASVREDTVWFPGSESRRTRPAASASSIGRSALRRDDFGQGIVIHEHLACRDEVMKRWILESRLDPASPLARRQNTGSCS